jgi:hypothetical protein
LLAYAFALPVIMFGVNYLRGRASGASPELAALASGLVVALVLGMGAWLLYDHKRKGGRIDWEGADDRHPGEGHQPRGWWWDDQSKRWRKPPRPGP